MSELVTKADLKAAFDKQARQLTLRFGMMLGAGFIFILLEFVVVARCAA
jgi:hypothetical protein